VKKMIYTVAKEQTLQDLVNVVNDALNAGYMPIGGFVYVTGYWAQTLIGEVEVPEEGLTPDEEDIQQQIDSEDK
jgi:hypothetical protein